MRKATKVDNSRNKFLEFFVLLSTGRIQRFVYRKVMVPKFVEGVSETLNLNIELEPRRDVLIVRLSGELDHHTSEDVRTKIDETLSNDRFPHVVFNLQKVTFMDSSGLGVILGRYKQINQLGGTLAVCSLTPPVYKLFELSGMFKIVKAYDREDQALRSLGVA